MFDDDSPFISMIEGLVARRLGYLSRVLNNVEDRRDLLDATDTPKLLLASPIENHAKV